MISSQVAERKTREATRNEKWGPHGRVLSELAQVTTDEDGYGTSEEILRILKRYVSRI